jgi:hypothetical protein
MRVNIYAMRRRNYLFARSDALAVFALPSTAVTVV